MAQTPGGDRAARPGDDRQARAGGLSFAFFDEVGSAPSRVRDIFPLPRLSTPAFNPGFRACRSTARRVHRRLAVAKRVNTCVDALNLMYFRARDWLAPPDAGDLLSLPQCQLSALAHLIGRVRELGPKSSGLAHAGALEELRVQQQSYAGDPGQGARAPHGFVDIAPPCGG